MLGKIAPADFAEVIHSNLTGALLATQTSLPLMAAPGHMVYIGAYVDHLVLPKMGAYALAKSGLETMVAVWRKEQRRARFTIVRPGAVDTPFWAHAPFRMPADAKAPRQVAQAILAHHTDGATGDLNL
jgi:3-oxoacyl-[acyl-carrier protein] reductase